MYFVKRHDLKNETTIIEAKFEDKSEAEKRSSELCFEEEKLETTTCIFEVDDTEENKLSYKEMIRRAIIQVAIEEGLPLKNEDISDEMIETFQEAL